ncbi:MAG: hypothetical protein ACP5R5_04750 [Armatimonadota bacterium]
MSRTAHMSLRLLAVLVGTSTVAAWGSQATPDFLAAALGYQESVPIDVRYKLGENGKDFMEVHYVRTSEFMRREDRELAGEVVIQSYYDRATDDFRSLKTGRGSKEGVGFVSLGTFDQLSQTDTLDPVLLPLPGARSNRSGDVALRSWVGRGEVVGTEDVDGHACWRVEVRPEVRGRSIKKHIIWLDPTVGFCPRLVKIVWRTGGASVFRFEDYFEVCPGIWFPRALTCKVPPDPGDEIEPGGEKRTLLYARLEDVKCGATMSKEDATVRFPSGARVRVWVSEEEYEYVQP